MHITPSVSYFRGITPSLGQAVIAHRNAEAAAEAENYLEQRHQNAKAATRGLDIAM